MTRRRAIADIEAVLTTLADEQVQALADLARRWTEPTVFSTFSAAERAEIDALSSIVWTRASQLRT